MRLDWIILVDGIFVVAVKLRDEEGWTALFIIGSDTSRDDEIFEKIADSEGSIDEAVVELIIATVFIIWGEDVWSLSTSRLFLCLFWIEGSISSLIEVELITSDSFRDINAGRGADIFDIGFSIEDELSVPSVMEGVENWFDKSNLDWIVEFVSISMFIKLELGDTREVVKARFDVNITVELMPDTKDCVEVWINTLTEVEKKVFVEFSLGAGVYSTVVEFGVIWELLTTNG